MTACLTMPMSASGSARSRLVSKKSFRLDTSCKASECTVAAHASQDEQRAGMPCTRGCGRQLWPRPAALDVRQAHVRQPRTGKHRRSCPGQPSCPWASPALHARHTTSNAAAGAASPHVPAAVVLDNTAIHPMNEICSCFSTHVPVAVVLEGVHLHFLGQCVGDDVVPDVHQLRPVHQPARSMCSGTGLGEAPQGVERRAEQLRDNSTSVAWPPVHAGSVCTPRRLHTQAMHGRASLLPGGSRAVVRLGDGMVQLNGRLGDGNSTAQWART